LLFATLANVPDGFQVTAVASAKKNSDSLVAVGVDYRQRYTEEPRQTARMSVEDQSRRLR
jgi:hypothetical protein